MYLNMKFQSSLLVRSVLFSSVGRPSFHKYYSMYATAAAFHKALETLVVYWNVITLPEEYGEFKLVLQSRIYFALGR